VLNKKKEYLRLVANHSAKEYARGEIHTNGIESFWAVLKRGIFGIYHHISVKYMQRYIDEFCFRANDASFDAVLAQSVL
jgi:hypothetical protein